jgi:tetratricopeptide (TPR) repeat protein
VRPAANLALGGSSLAKLLLRPFIDLEPCARGPLCALGIEQYWTAFADPDCPRFVLQRILPHSFRLQLLREASCLEYQVEDPREVPPDLRSERWGILCAALDVWPTLTIDGQCRLALLLHALCLYSLISSQIPDVSDAEIAADPDFAELAYRRAVARYVLNLSGVVADYGHADLRELERVAATAPPRVVTLNAALKILVHKAKSRVPVDELVQWRERTAGILEAIVAECDEFTLALLRSRFYRAAAFIPQRIGDRDQVVWMMDLAERHGREMSATNKAQGILRLENLYPLLESRIKEAIWLGNLDSALTRAQALVDLDPYDSRAWIELGHVYFRRGDWAHAAEAFVVSATLGAPATAVGHHMAGLCFRRLGHPALAAHFFKSSLETDPHAISPHDQIQSLPDLPVFSALKQWSVQVFEA